MLQITKQMIPSHVFWYSCFGYLLHARISFGLFVWGGDQVIITKKDDDGLGVEKVTFLVVVVTYKKDDDRSRLGFSLRIANQLREKRNPTPTPPRAKHHLNK